MYVQQHYTEKESWAITHEDRYEKNCDLLREFMVLQVRFPKQCKDTTTPEHKIAVFRSQQRSLHRSNGLHPYRRQMLDDIHPGILDDGWGFGGHIVKPLAAWKQHHQSQNNDGPTKDVYDSIDGEPMDEGVHTTPSVTTETLSFDISGNQIELDQKDTRGDKEGSVKVDRELAKCVAQDSSHRSIRKRSAPEYFVAGRLRRATAATIPTTQKVETDMHQHVAIARDKCSDINTYQVRDIAIAERDKEIAKKGREILKRDARIEYLNKQVASLKADARNARNVKNRDKEMRALERDLARKDEYIASLKADVDDRDVIIAEYQAREDEIALLNDELAAKEKEIALLTKALSCEPHTDQAQPQPKVVSVQLDYEHINCDICKSEYSTDMNNKDERMRLPVLSSSKSCDHWFCHGCILQQQATLAEDNNANVPKWIPCMVCRTKTAFCPSEPKYHRMLIGLLKQSKWTEASV